MFSALQMQQEQIKQAAGHEKGFRFLSYQLLQNNQKCLLLPSTVTTMRRAIPLQNKLSRFCVV